MSRSERIPPVEDRPLGPGEHVVVLDRMPGGWWKTAGATVLVNRGGQLELMLRDGTEVFRDVGSVRRSGFQPVRRT